MGVKCSNTFKPFLPKHHFSPRNLGKVELHGKVGDLVSVESYTLWPFWAFRAYSQLSPKPSPNASIG